MSRGSEKNISVTVNGRTPPPIIGDEYIGFSETSIPVQQGRSTRHCGSLTVQECIEERRDESCDGDNDSSSEEEESESCDSGSELTGNRRGNNRNNNKSSADVDPGAASVCGESEGVRKKPFKASGSRLRVGFVAMEESDTNANKKDINKDLSKWSKRGTGSIRYTQPRLSLLGKPINYKMHKRDARYRRLQSRIYNFLERPKAWWAFLYHILICAACVAALICSTLSTIKRFEPEMSLTVMYLEPVMLLWLIIEYSLRIWSSGCRSRYQGWKGRMKFAQRPLCIVDAIIIMSVLLVMIVGGAASRFPASTLRGLRFFQILRMVRIDRKAGTWKLLASVVWAHRRELLTTLYIGFLGLLLSSYVVYLTEKDDNPERFGTYADALWWGVVTLCTVGYGDVVPETWAGKLIASFSALIGIAFFALPAGILGSGFALKVQQQQRQKHLIRRRVPAAQLIQSLWRCYAADENSMSIATWKPHMIPCPSPAQERPLKANSASFVSRFSTRRKDRGASSSRESGNISPHSPMVSRREIRKNEQLPEEEIVPDTLQRSHLSLATGLVDQRVDKLALMKENSVQSFCSKHEQSEEEQDLSPRVRELTEQHKKAIRSLRKIKYFVSRRKFREALRPYDVKDVIEQYSAGHVDMLGRVKSLQCRLDQILGKAGSKNKDVYESKVSLSSRIVKVERQVEDIESKLDLLIDLYKEDRKILLQVHKPLPEASPDKDQQKPRSILVDKQYTSEPSSPITSKHPTRLMQRNHSDLSSRIRKRVTYRLNSGPPKSASPTANFGDNTFIIPETTFSKHLTEASCDIHPNENIADDVFPDDTDTYKDSSNEPLIDKDDTDGSDNSDPDQDDSDGSSPDIQDDDYSEHQGYARRNHQIPTRIVVEDISATSSKPQLQSVDDLLSEPNDVCSVNSNCVNSSMVDGQMPNDIGCYPNCKTSPDRANSDHVVLMPLGSSQALMADVTDV